ncbi:hypothetical protein M406DRAFT_322815 [Cryphonectria parasitica EP155]|uniref:N-acetyltransferase domain-containing protein n=1 Tax=Cryphonectria parasitica (strain ATCC 38755 / EP155) TaxID=660469 RepID=A0A9P4Y1S8_CRYP1|nr:uncharacterized protein M406DRAFT_322815 [Cryphonectria parasitica EP155]KAF3764966.1 hypothetical protein M406DRAFT_322815 [Cryphonectria parasitica EP155]
MPEDKDWWDYRFHGRLEHPDDHRKFFRILVQAWISPDNEDCTVLIAEVYEEAAGAWQAGGYAAWNVAYVNLRKHGKEYQSPNIAAILNAAGAETRRDANAARSASHARAADEGHARYLDPVYGIDQIYLQALGTHPSFTRRGVARGLVRWGMDRAVRDGVVAVLQAAPMARAVYPRFGFEELGMVTAQVEGEEEKTFLWPMVWDPKKQAPAQG